MQMKLNKNISKSYASFEKGRYKTKSDYNDKINFNLFHYYCLGKYSEKEKEIMQITEKAVSHSRVKSKTVTGGSGTELILEVRLKDGDTDFVQKRLRYFLQPTVKMKKIQKDQL